MGKGAGKGRGDDSSSSSDETDAKVKFLYTVICLLCGLCGGLPCGISGSRIGVLGPLERGMIPNVAGVI